MGILAINVTWRRNGIKKRLNKCRNYQKSNLFATTSSFCFVSFRDLHHYLVLHLMRKYSYHCSMSHQDTLPAKKKKKRSAFEADDFFVLKKSKKTKSPAPKLALPRKSGESAKSGESTSLINSAVSSDSFHSDDLLQSFHSARDTFSGDENPVELTQMTESTAQNRFGSKTLRDDNSRNTKQNILDDEDNVEEVDEDPDSALSTFFKGIASQKEDSSRVYDVEVISKVFDCEEEIEVGGDVTFENIVREMTLKRGFYIRDRHSILMWVEGRSELKPFFKPSTLRIPPSPDGKPSKVTVLHIGPVHLPHLDKLYDEYGEKGKNGEDTSISSDHHRTDDVVLVGDESPKSTSPKGSLSEYFVIGLKGKDNRRIECEVGPNTRIRDLLSYYLKVKKLDEKNVQNPRLVFDDEVLDMNGTVGDTELEEDFEVQIHI